MQKILGTEFPKRESTLGKKLPTAVTRQLHRTSKEEYEQWLKEDAREFSKHNIDKTHNMNIGTIYDSLLGNTIVHKAGFFYIQESAPSIPASIIPITEGEIILDMCAAPGGKTVQLADRLLSINNKKPGLVVANDINENRLRSLSHNVNRTGAYNSIVTHFNATQFGRHLPNFFDHVLLDAPCSGEGTTHKRNDSIKRRKIETAKKMARVQRKLLLSAFKSVKIGGTITYATCTLNHRENEEIVHRALKTFGDQIQLADISFSDFGTALSSYENQELLNPIEAKKCIRCRPHLHNMGGFFIAQFIKLADKSSLKQSSGLMTGNPFGVDLSSKLQSSVSNHLINNWGYKEIPEALLFVQIGETIHAVSKNFKRIKSHIRAKKIGIPVLKILNGSYEPTEHFIKIFGRSPSMYSITLTNKQAKQYFETKEVVVSTDKNKGNAVLTHVILLRRNKAIGIIKLPIAAVDHSV